MAIGVPESVKSSATAGERRSFSFLKENLPDDWIIYYEPVIDQQRPDLVIISPELGFLVLEVKDYKPSTILEATRNTWKIKLPGGEHKYLTNPQGQAHKHMFRIKDLLTKEPRLHNIVNGVQMFKVRYAHGVILFNINSADFYGMGLNDCMSDHCVLRSEELDPSHGGLLEKITGMFEYRQPAILTKDEVDAMRYHLFPEVRLADIRRYSEENLRKMKSLPVMDLYQENLAKQMGPGHRILKGVAGSGKTVILLARVRKLAVENPDWKILVLLFGVTLSSHVKEMLNANGELINVEVKTFGEFIREKFSLPGTDLVEGFLESYPSLPIQYDSIAIDEMQDWETPWLRLVLKLLNPETMSLFLTEDKAQDIFKRKISYAQQLGLDFRGRTRQLKMNYRNPKPVLELAWNFYSYFSGNKKDPEVIPPESANREGLYPVFKSFESLGQECQAIATQILYLKQQGVRLEDIAILHRAKTYGKKDYIGSVLTALNNNRIEHTWVSENRKTKSSFSNKSGGVKILTLDSSKGLDFKYVFLMGLEVTPFKVKDVTLEEEVSRLYTGMTRALEALYMSCSGRSDFVDFFTEQFKQRV